MEEHDGGNRIGVGFSEESGEVKSAPSQGSRV